MKNETAEAFLTSPRPHLLMVTNHGIHDWTVDAGLPDTGGQNLYVNQLSRTLASLGFRVTIFNRGGYGHPKNGAPREGVRYRNGEERIIYLEDGRGAFILKEDMGPQIDALAEDLVSHLRASGPVELIISHYWDAAAVTEQARSVVGREVPHLWIPHSLGELKRKGTPEALWKDLKLEERVAWERRILEKVDAVGATSQAMRDTLREEYAVRESLFLPPCVDEDRFNPEAARRDSSAVDLLASATDLPVEEIKGLRIITEVSRTDRTKRKDILIEAFATVATRFPDTLLAVTVDPGARELYGELEQLIEDLALSRRVALLGSIGEYLPSLYGMSTVYCTPSVMEGFGMSIQEAAACGVPAVASARVPFAVEYLRGESFEARGEIEVGEGAVIVPPDSVEATSKALLLLLEDEDRRRGMGEAAYRITIPRFTWEVVTRSFLGAAGIAIPGEGGGAHG